MVFDECLLAFIPQNISLPKKSTCVSNDQFDAFAVAEVTNVLLFIKCRVGQHHHLDQQTLYDARVQGEKGEKRKEC